MPHASEGSSSDESASFILVEDSQEKSRTNQVSTPIAPWKDRNLPNTHPSCSDSYRAGDFDTYAHEWYNDDLRIHGRHFVDRYGRVCNLRGVNVSGSSKAPTNHDDTTFPHNAQTVTFVGRPFSIDEAPQHLARLRRWGLTFVRFLVFWEAVEHEGPGIYDTEYLQYIRDLLSLLPHYGIVAFVVLHQDVWSRYTGGSGAPAWTLEKVGLNLHELESTGAAWLRGVTGGGHIEDERGLWPCGYHKLAASTMATCFWAGDTFAPKLLIEDTNGAQIPVQQYLQNKFLDMFTTVVKAVGDLDAVMGFEMMNEPHPGYINRPSLHTFDYNVDLHLGHIPSAFESFQLGAGHPTEVSFWSRSFPMPTKKTGTRLLNPEGRSAWLPDGPTKGKCLWEMHDVWGWDQSKNIAVVLRENYFVKDPMTGKKVDFYADFFIPFLNRWADVVRTSVPVNKPVFVEAVPNEFCPPSMKEGQPSNMVYAPHWYDLNGLFSKAFGDFSVNVQGLSRGMFPLRAFYWGHYGVRKNFSLQIRNIVEKAYAVIGERPIIVGETGIPMDINNGEAFTTDDWSWQSRMMDAIITAMDASMIGFTLWNYNPSNDDKLGDEWNGENFSWFSRKRALPPFLLFYEQDAPSLDNGGRILNAVVRPYAAKTAGIPLKFSYEMTTGEFSFEWCNPQGGKELAPSPTVAPPLTGHPELKARETELFVPHMLTAGRNILVEGLEKEDQWRYDPKRQTLFIVHSNTTPGKKHHVEVKVDPPVRAPFVVNDFWDDFGMLVTAVIVVFLAIIFYWAGKFSIL